MFHWRLDHDNVFHGFLIHSLDDLDLFNGRLDHENVFHGFLIHSLDLGSDKWLLLRLFRSEESQMGRFRGLLAHYDLICHLLFGFL